MNASRRRKAQTKKRKGSNWSSSADKTSFLISKSQILNTYARLFFLTMTITLHYHKRPFSKSKKVKREYINGNHLPTRINDILCKQPTKSVRHILLPVNCSARGLRLLRATRLINNSFESILDRLRLL